MCFFCTVMSIFTLAQQYFNVFFSCFNIHTTLLPTFEIPKKDMSPEEQGMLGQGSAWYAPLVTFFPLPDKVEASLWMSRLTFVCPRFVSGADLWNPWGDFFHITHIAQHWTFQSGETINVQPTDNKKPVAEFCRWKNYTHNNIVKKWLKKKPSN